MKQDYWTEADIAIGGKQLNFRQSMTLRVAIGNFLLELNDSDFRKELGAIGDGYYQTAKEIESLIHADIKQQSEAAPGQGEQPHFQPHQK